MRWDQAMVSRHIEARLLREAGVDVAKPGLNVQGGDDVKSVRDGPQPEIGYVGSLGSTLGRGR
jgi:hypothetical protein